MYRHTKLQTLADHMYLIILILIFSGLCTSLQENICKNCEKHLDAISIIPFHATDRLQL